MDYQDHTGPDGEHDNPGGTAGFILYAPKRYFTSTGVTSAKKLGVASTLAELGLNSDPFVFKSGKGWHKRYLTFNTGEVEAAIQGELDGHSYKLTGKGFEPGVEPEQLGHYTKAKVDRFVVLVPLADGTDRYIQFGDKFFDAYIKGTKIGTAKNSDGRRGTEFELSCQASGMSLYDGTIDYYTPQS